MNNRHNNSSNFKLQSSQKMREIENLLERDITGIVNKKRMFEDASNRNAGFSGMSESVSSKLKSFLDDRLASRGLGEKGFNEKAYDQSLDYEYDDKYNNHNNHYQQQVASEDNNEDYDDYYEDDNDYYEDDNEGYDDDYEEDDYYNDDVKKGKTNPNSYLPFTYEELQPEIPSEEVVLEAMMPAIAEWLDLNIDRIVHKAVKETLSNRGEPNKYSARGNMGTYSKEASEYSTRYKQLDRKPHLRSSDRLDRTRVAKDINPIEKSSVRVTKSSRVHSSYVARDSEDRNSSVKDNHRLEAQRRNSSVKKKSSVKSAPRSTDRVASSVEAKSSKSKTSSTNNRNTTKR